MVKHIVAVEWILLILCSLYYSSSSQYSSYLPRESPCPNVFTYETENSVSGQWYALLLVTTDVTLYGVWVDVILDKQADSLVSSFGTVSSTNNKSFKIENTRQVLGPGSSLQIRIHVNYNALHVAPKITNLRQNGQEICSSSHVSLSHSNPSRTHSVSESVNYNRETYSATSKPLSTGRRENSNERNESPSYNRRDGSYDESIYALSNLQPAYSERDPSSRTRETPVDNGYRTSRNNNNARRVSPSYESPYVDTSNMGKVIPLSPSISSSTSPKRGNNARTPSMSSVSTQTGGRRPVARDEYESNDEDHIDVEYRPPTRKSSRGSDPSQDYFQGDHRLSDSEKIYPTPNPSRRTTTQRYDTEYANRDSSPQLCGKVAAHAAPLIVSGEIAQQGQWPWHVAIYQSQTVDSKYICGGSLVTSWHVLTAAHCVARRTSVRPVNPQTLTIYLGKFNLRKASEGVQIKLVQKIHIHSEYNYTNFYADLAILKFTRSSEYSTVVRPVCMWKDTQTDLANVIGKEGSVVGWGFDENNSLREELAMVKMPVVEQTTCLWSFREFFSHFTSNHSYCAGYANGTSVCNGDSGGGMVFSESSGYGSSSSTTWYLRGVVSISVARQNEFTCDPYHYVVFTDVAQYLTWIHQHTNS